MKVKKLIEELQKLDPEAEVVNTSSNFELHHSLVPCKRIYTYKTGSKRKESFTDAFDGIVYEKEIYHITGGDLTLVMID